MDWIVSLTAEAAGASPVAALHAPPKHATVIELRADLFPGLDLRQAVSASPLPLLVTLRSRAEGGAGPDDPGTRAPILRSAFEAGAALVDLEWTRDAALMTSMDIPPEQIVLSWHDAEQTPPHLEETCAAMLETPARWVKVVPSAVSLADLERCLSLHSRFNTGRPPARRLIALAMGLVGVPSRYLGPLLGPPIAFVAWSPDAPAAPGQLTRPFVDRVIGHLSAPPQRLFGVVGGDVTGSLSPVMHAAAYREHGLPYLFLPVSAPLEHELGELITPLGGGLFDRVGLRPHGWAVTAPYKRHAAAAASIQAPRVQRCGAANTLILRERAIIAENTDADGVTGALRSLGVDPAGQVALVQGTGGAARGAAIGLHLAGATVYLRGRDDLVTRRTADELRLDWCPATETPDGASILVNATPVGSHTDDPAPFRDTEITTAAAVLDMVYADHVTALAEGARSAGRPLADGRDLLAHQGFAQIAAFTGKLPPKAAMREALNEE